MNWLSLFVFMRNHGSNLSVDKMNVVSSMYVKPVAAYRDRTFLKEDGRKIVYYVYRIGF